jgi:hypothetical protein
LTNWGISYAKALRICRKQKDSYLHDIAQSIEWNGEGRLCNFDLTNKQPQMKKTMNLIIALFLSSFLFSSCANRIFEGRTYVSGQHATKAGTKAQARADKQTKHFWF